MKKEVRKMKEKIYKTLEKIFRKYRSEKENNIDYESAKMILKNDKQAILVDVRSPQEYREGHLEGSINIPLYDLERNCQLLQDKKENTIIIYCQSGSRSRKAIQLLQEQSCSNLYELEGGLDNID